MDREQRELEIDRVVSMFSLFSDLTGEELEPWRAFCEGAKRRVETRLRPGVDVGGAMEDLCNAAAAWAYCDYLMAGGRADAAGAEEIRVGDITLRQGSGQSEKYDAKEIRDYFLGEVDHLLESSVHGLFAIGGGA